MRINKFYTVPLWDDDAGDSMPLGGGGAMAALYGGGYDQLGGATNWQARQFTRRFNLMRTPGSEVRDKLDDLSMAIDNGRSLLRGELDDGTAIETLATCRSAGYQWQPGDAGKRPVSLVFEAPYPYWLLSADEPVKLSDGYLIDSPAEFTLDYGNNTAAALTSTSQDVVLTNSGPVSIPRSTIIIAPQAASSISDITIWNTANNQRLRWSGSLTAGQTLYIQTLSKSAHVDGSGAYADIEVDSRQRLWMTLAPGSNTITITSAALTGTIDLTWAYSQHYLI
jgi:hypothetical protein